MYSENISIPKIGQLQSAWTSHGISVVGIQRMRDALKRISNKLVLIYNFSYS